MGAIQAQPVYSLEESFINRLLLLRKRNVDRLFWENFEEISDQIARKVPNSQGSEEAKRLVLSSYEHVCRKAGSTPAWADTTKTALQGAVAAAKRRSS